jgi:hypothetical protein
VRDHYSPMKVGNVGFMIDRIGQDCGPLHYLRELTQNSIQAIQKTPEGTGEIIWDFYRPYYDQPVDLDNPVKKLCIIDTGVGMDGPEMVEYINSAFRSSHEQGHDKNFGIGAKVAAATRNPHGLWYLSWKNGKGAAVRLLKDPETGQYGLERFPLADDKYGNWTPIDDQLKPEQIDGHGTVVVLLGENEDDDTFTLPKEKVVSEVSWVAYYLNTRYFVIPEGIAIRASEHRSYGHSDDADPRYSMRQVTGQKYILDQICESKGSVDLDDATAHWWILKELGGGQQKGLTSGHIAALYQDELYEVLPLGRGGFGRLQTFGVVLGHSKVVLYLEPKTSTGKEVIANTARTRLIVNGEDLPWSEWGAQFREKMPQEIKDLMDAIAARSTQNVDREDIKRRIEEFEELYNPSRYRRTPGGSERVGEPSIIGGVPSVCVQGDTGSGPPGGTGGSIGNPIYSTWIKKDGAEAERIKGKPYPEIRWVSVKEGSRDREFMEDRAANYAREANFLSINADFRIFDDLITFIDIRNPDVPGGKQVIEKLVERHVEMALTETVLTFLGISGSKHWPEEALDKALSEEALTAAVMPRQHIVHNVETDLRRMSRMVAVS